MCLFYYNKRTYSSWLYLVFVFFVTLVAFVHLSCLSFPLDDQFHAVFGAFVSSWHNVDDGHFQILLHLGMNSLINLLIVRVCIQNPFVINERINKNYYF